LDLDQELDAIESAIDGEAGRRYPASMLDGVAQCLACGEPDIRDLAVGETASARESGHAAPRQSHVPDLACVVCAKISLQCCSRYYEFPGRDAQLNLPQQPGAS
jgi:hypothetical protein